MPARENRNLSSDIGVIRTFKFIQNKLIKKLLNEIQHKSFHRCVSISKLIYLAHHCRPDVLCSVIFLSSRVQEPNEDDWNKLQ